MTECEVCLKPTMALTPVVFADGAGETFTVQYCKDCIRVVFIAMVGRYRNAIAENNAAVAELVRVFGVPDDDPLG